MTLGVCNCVCGPPANGRCMACGAVGPTVPMPPGQQGVSPLERGTLTIIREPGPSEADIRRIVREELERARTAATDKENRREV